VTSPEYDVLQHHVGPGSYKNRPSLFPGQSSQKATASGFNFCIYFVLKYFYVPVEWLHLFC